MSSSKPKHPIKPIAGIRLAAASAQLYSSNRDDLVLIELSPEASTSAVFTTNKFQAAPVSIAKLHLAESSPRYLFINAGNANAGTGALGIEAANQCLEAVANFVGCSPVEILPFSTGVIGEPLPTEKILNKIPDLVAKLDADNFSAAAKAIMTTDTVEKLVSTEVEIDGEIITITGMAKGSGMIQPNMATMLAYIFTDAEIEQKTLEQCLHQATTLSFNRITVDGDMSTNDACVLVASGSSAQKIDVTDNNSYKTFTDTLNSVFIELAKKIIRDGEGASKFITIHVQQGKTIEECEKVAYQIANSPLVKTACFASDANWGRILAAVGAADIPNLEVEQVAIYIDDLCIVEGGMRHQNYSETEATHIMQQHDISIRVLLHRGQTEATVWTTDLSYEYIKINAEYRT